MRDYHNKKEYQNMPSDRMLILLVVFTGYVFITLLLEAF